MAKPMKVLGAYLKKCGLTQVEFARRVGVSQSVISDLIRGQHAPSLDLLVRLSKETGLTLDELVTSRAA
jgi:transcriptional regulator with XRE-family HTH domain